MKRTVLISTSLLLAFAGCTCGGGRPNFFSRLSDRFHSVGNYGAPCDAGCHAPAPAATSGCETCGTSAHYGGYDGQVIGTYEGIPTETVVGSSTTGMGSVPSGAYISPTYPSNAASGVRMGSEGIRPKPAN